MKKLISASLMCGNLLSLKSEISTLQSYNVDMLHLDIMDGHFVPNITFGPDITNAIQSISLIPCDYHLMVEKPSMFLSKMNFTENDYVSIHFEIDKDEIDKSIKIVKDRGAKFGFALNPSTDIKSILPYIDNMDLVLLMLVNPGFAGQNIVKSTLDKIKNLKKLLAKHNPNILISVDGGVSHTRASKLSKDGANIFVGGTSGLFKHNMPLKQSLEILRNNISMI